MFSIRFPGKNLSLIRGLLGLALFARYFSMVFHPEPYFGPAAFARFFSNPTCSTAISLVAMACCLAFALGRKPRLAGAVILLIHGLWSGITATFGWAPLIDPLLVYVILASGNDRVSAWSYGLLRIHVSAVFAWVAWSQLGESPWLNQAIVSRYVQDSPFAEAVPHFRGFIPLVVIIGGMAWLGQLVAPLALWHRKAGRYFAAGMIALHSLLALFMPVVFWNAAAVTALVAFLPEEWLTLRKRYWVSELPRLKEAGTVFAFSFIMAVMLSTIFDRNIAEQFDIFEKIGSPTVEKTYEIATNPFVEIGNLILFNSIWKMYSPTWRHVVWIEWYYRNPDGTTASLPQENFSPDYRMRRRTWAEATWTDFKKEKVFVGMLSGRNERAAYAKYLCHVMRDTTGRAPAAIHPEIYSFNIRGPEEQWSLRDQKYEFVQKDPEVACD